MRFDIMTLFPDLVDHVLSESIIGRARKSGAIEVYSHNIRDYTLDKHRRVDDTPYGGGMGMLMATQPIYDCYSAVVKMQDNEPDIAESEQSTADAKNKMELGERLTNNKKTDTDGENRRYVVYMSPRGTMLNHKTAQRLAGYKNLIILCGHYEGVDQRILDEIVDEEISIGDYVLTGGEIPACILVDCVARLVPGVLSADECFSEESIASGLLEYPQYTRPPVFHGREVPEVLLSGHHGNIEKWRHEEALKLTAERRPDLYAAYREEHPEEFVEKKKRKKKPKSETI